MDRTIGSSLISISFLSGGKQIRLTSPADWERAVRVGEISPTSLVVIEHGAVTEAVDRSMTVRVLVSAADAGKNGDLRNLLRERLVQWLQKHPQYLPMSRIENRSRVA